MKKNRLFRDGGDEQPTSAAEPANEVAQDQTVTENATAPVEEASASTEA